jgi:hypothetical protein
VLGAQPSNRNNEIMLSAFTLTKPKKNFSKAPCPDVVILHGADRQRPLVPSRRGNPVLHCFCITRAVRTGQSTSQIRANGLEKNPWCDFAHTMQVRRHRDDRSARFAQSLCFSIARMDIGSKAGASSH